MTHEEKEDIDATHRRMVLDENAVSADLELPAFLAKPEGAPVYYGFPLIYESMTEGWCLGAITEYEDSDGCVSGDAFVIAPDGSRAGLVWDVGDGDVKQISPPDGSRWGVFQICFAEPVRTTEDMVRNFRTILPQLRKFHEQLANR
jgi:hypothetical protein